ncbi:hypothetical protein EGW08_022132 [Elysia chlorotica]|uniref:Uncharacterized protein n=1 Tax=Elysia chlorotica TaxID=188477 RepID=A0A3S1AWG1_ELYCH|nr:hypothetical protein EGW08_022132 [Elysia chlorotica]
MWNSDKLILWLTVLLAACVGRTVAESIDDTIVMAANSTQEFEFFYDEPHHLVKVELDMIYTMEEWEEIQRLNGSAEWAGPAKRTAGIISGRGGGRYWTSNTVPYEISGSFSSQDRSQIQLAVNESSLNFHFNDTRHCCRDKQNMHVAVLIVSVAI